MRVVSWNMNHCRRSPDARARAWSYLRDTLRPDVALLQEVAPPSGLAAVYKAIDATSARYDWGSAIVALSPQYELLEWDRRLLTAPPAERTLPESHPGTTAVADVVRKDTGQTCFVAASVYGQWDYLPSGDIYSASTIHRILSDLTPLLVWTARKPHKTPVLLAGDFNATTQVAATVQWKVEEEEADVLFRRIRALGLHDVVTHTAGSRPRLDPCSCPRPNDCSHVRTYRNNNKTDSRPTQLDYAFCSEALLRRVVACEVHDLEPAWALSDHCPLVLDLADAASGTA